MQTQNIHRPYQIYWNGRVSAVIIIMEFIRQAFFVTYNSWSPNNNNNNTEKSSKYVDQCDFTHI